MPAADPARVRMGCARGKWTQIALDALWEGDV
jgi:hypothetical protein